MIFLFGQTVLIKLLIVVFVLGRGGNNHSVFDQGVRFERHPASARLYVLIFYLSCLFSPNMEGLGHFRLSDSSMGNQATISDIKMDSIA